MKRKYRKRPDGEKVKCEQCGLKEDLEWHHIIYLSKGGSDDPENLQILCHTCHRNVHRKLGDWVEFGIKGGRKRQKQLMQKLGEAKYAEYQKTLALVRWGKVEKGAQRRLLQA